jgi:hypothetical protein
MLITITAFAITAINLQVFIAHSASNALKPACRIEIGNAHLSTFLMETDGDRAVKVNATSICNVTHSHVKLTVRIYKVGMFHNYLVAQRATNPMLPSSTGLRIQNQDTFMKCKTNQVSSYYGIAFADATISGQKVAAPPARSKRIIPLECGN